jgi:hypothetical protein
LWIRRRLDRRFGPGDADGTWEVGPEAGNKFSVYGYENWGGVEPNDLNTNARAYMTSVRCSPVSRLANGLFRPMACRARANPIKGYFVEYRSLRHPFQRHFRCSLLLSAALGFFGWRRARIT